MGRSRLAAAAAPLLLILAACSGGATPTPAAPSAAPSVAPSVAPSQAAASTPPASTGTGASPSEAASETYDLKIAAGSGSVTNYLTAEDGKTLYEFANDVADSGKSACGAGACLSTWPPLTVDSLDEIKPDSGVSGKLALITRDDGTKQVTYNGKPLYYFAGDKAAGDTNGVSIAGWGVAKP